MVDQPGQVDFRKPPSEKPTEGNTVAPEVPPVISTEGNIAGPKEPLAEVAGQPPENTPPTEVEQVDATEPLAEIPGTSVAPIGETPTAEPTNQTNNGAAASPLEENITVAGSASLSQQEAVFAKQVGNNAENSPKPAA